MPCIMAHLIARQPKLGLVRGGLAKLRMFLARLGLGNYDMAALFSLSRSSAVGR